MNNFKALKTEKSIRRIIAKIERVEENRRHDLVVNYRKILLLLIKKWEKIKGDTVNNNAAMYHTLMEKLSGE